MSLHKARSLPSGRHHKNGVACAMNQDFQVGLLGATDIHPSPCGHLRRQNFALTQRFTPLTPARAS